MVQVLRVWDGGDTKRCEATCEWYFVPPKCSGQFDTKTLLYDIRMQNP